MAKLRKKNRIDKIGRRNDSIYKMSKELSLKIKRVKDKWSKQTFVQTNQDKGSVECWLNLTKRQMTQARKNKARKIKDRKTKCRKTKGRNTKGPKKAKLTKSRKTQDENMKTSN